MGRKKKNARSIPHGRKIHVNKYLNKCEKDRKLRCTDRTKKEIGEEKKAIMHTPSPLPKRGDIWYANLGNDVDTSVQSGIRPVLVLSNNISNSHARTYNVLPLTGRMKRTDLPPHVVVTPEDCWLEAGQRLDNSVVLTEQITTIDKTHLMGRVCQVTNEKKLWDVEKALADQLGLYPLASSSMAAKQ